MTMKSSELFLHEKLLLLALRDERGTIESKANMYKFALGGAILTELSLAGAITIDADKKALVNPGKTDRFREPVLDECVDMVTNARRRRRAQSWVLRFAQIRRLRHRIAEGLCRRGILRNEDKSVLILFKRKVYPTIDSGPEQKLLKKIERAVVSDSPRLAPETAIIVSLAHATGILRVHFDRKTLKVRKKRLKQILDGDLISGATRDAVQAAQAAAMTAVLAASVAASASAAT